MSNVHPLVEKIREPKYWKTWPEWLEAWEKAECAEEMLQLLHNGFRIEDPSHEVERLVFYLQIAEGWISRETFKREDDSELSCSENYLLIPALGGRRLICSYAEFRQVIATTAFEVLVRDRLKQVKSLETNNLDKRQATLKALFHFFRIKKNGPEKEDGFVNLNAREVSPAEESAKRFLFKLCLHLWEQDSLFDGGTPFRTKGNLGQKLPDLDLFPPYTEQIVHTLHLLNKLGDVLTWPHVIAKITPAWIPVLRELALEKELHSLPGSSGVKRKPLSIEEAMVGHTGDTVGCGSVHVARGYFMLKAIRSELFSLEG